MEMGWLVVCRGKRFEEEEPVRQRKRAPDGVPFAEEKVALGLEQSVAGD